PQAQRGSDLLHRQLDERGIVGGLKPPAGGDVQLEQPGPALRVHRRELDAEAVERRLEPPEQVFEPEDLADAVAGAAREGTSVRVPDPDLVLEGREDVVAERRRRSEDTPE